MHTCEWINQGYYSFIIYLLYIIGGMIIITCGGIRIHDEREMTCDM